MIRVALQVLSRRRRPGRPAKWALDLESRMLRSRVLPYGRFHFTWRIVAVENNLLTSAKQLKQLIETTVDNTQLVFQ